MHSKKILALAAASLLSACASAPAVREAANPVDRAQRSITNFTPALRCMDELLFQAGVRDLTMVMDDMRDATQRVPVGARDIMTSAVSEMTRRSRALRLSLIGGDGGNLLQALQQAKEAQLFSVLPEYLLRGGVSQMDEDVQRSSATLGVSATVLGLRVGKDTRFSVMGFDAAMLRTDSFTLVSGVSSKNTTVLRRQETGASDGQATLRSAHTVFNFATTRNEGNSQAARNMVELAAIELVGKLTRLPYWQCLGTRDDDAEVQREIEDWFASMDGSERVAFVKERLRERRWYDGAIDGQDDDGFQQALRSYRSALGLAAAGPLDLAFFRRFINGAVPTGPLARPAQLAQLAHAANTSNTSNAAKATTLAGMAGAAAGATAVIRAAQGAAASTTQGLPTSAAQTIALPTSSASPQKPLAAATGLAHGVAATAALAGTAAPFSLRPVATAQGLALVLQARQTGYVYCYAQDPATQAIRRIFPNRFDRDPRVAAGASLALPGRGRFVLSPEHDHACLFAEREVYGDLPAVLRWGDFQDVKARSFEEIRQRFAESTGAAIGLVRAPLAATARAGR